ncbi:MAG TPA: energy transducer TonB [Dokdonella sp.]
MSLRSVAILLTVACAAPAAAQSVAPVRVVKPDNLAKYWVMVNASIEADVPNIARNISSPGCAAVSFVVEKDGSTSTIKVQRVIPAGDLAGIATSMAKNMRFEPTVSNAGRDRVFSWLIFPFNLPEAPAERTAVMQQCHIEKVGWDQR